MDYSNCFSKNDSARISFAVLGIFLILGSSATSVYISMYDTQIKENKIWSKNQHRMESILAAARADFSQIINAAGINTLQYLSSHPIISCSDHCNSAEEENLYRLKQKIAEVLTNYLHCNYADYSFSHGDVGLKADFSQLPNEEFSAKDIMIEPISMKLQRSFSIPFFGPEQQQYLPVYFKVNCEIPILILDISNTSYSIPINLPVSTVLTARYSLLENLISSFNDSLNGFGPFWRTMTLLANVYSMARGFRHYQTANPKNVVDNHHLELMSNLVFLFEEGLTFSGIDPQALIGLLKQSTSIFSKKTSTNVSLVNSLPSNEWSISFSKFQDIDESESHEKKPVQQQIINISDIAASILWDYESINLEFIDERDQKHKVVYKYDSEKSIEDTMQSYLDKGWQLIDSSKASCVQNQSTQDMMQSLSTSVYTASFHTKVNRRGPEKILINAHNGFPIDNGSSEWSVDRVSLQSQEGKPEKGSISVGSTVFKETYTVIWKRSHVWSNKTIEILDNETIVKWNNISTPDTKIEHNVSFSIILESYGDLRNIAGQIKDVCYENVSFQDSNLKTSLPTYKSSIYNVQKNKLFTAESGRYLSEKITESVPSWVLISARNELIDVYHQVSTIELSSEINPLNYPNPQKLISLACTDIIKRFNDNKTSFLQKQEYMDEDEFHCTGKKTMYAIRKWYVGCISQQLQEIENTLKKDVGEAISNALESAAVPDKKLYEEAMDENIISSLNRQLTLPFSLPMKLLSRESEENSWNESVLLSVNHKPGYCSCFSKEAYEDKKEYFLGIKNTCLLGPSGLAILPISPTTPWLITLNIWLIQIRGSFAEFSLSDASDETVFHPLFCHEPLVFIRKNEVIRSNDGTIIGWNKRISYAVDTIACSIVPSGGCMVGDTDGVIAEHHGKPIS